MNEKKLTPMMQQYFSIKNEYKDYILLYRLGDFYEMFFEDAILVSRELGITLTARNSGYGEKAPLCGVPYHSVDTYISKLIKKGYKLAICEQTEDPSKAKGIVKREVIKVITPGTVTDPNMLKDDSNNYIMSIYHNDSKIAIAYSDISTFDIYVNEINEDSLINKTIDEINKVSPKEIILSEEFNIKKVLDVLEDMDIMITRIPNYYYSHDKSSKSVKNTFKSFDFLLDDKMFLPVIGSLIEYIKETQKIKVNNFGDVKIYSNDSIMIMDKSTVNNLELFKTLRTNDKKGSLIWVLDKTNTSMGSRTLKNWILKPLLKIENIEKRLNFTEIFVKNDIVRDDISTSLKMIYDMERLISKLIYGNANPRDLISIKLSLSKIPNIKQTLSLLKSKDIKEFNDKILINNDVYDLINNSIVDEPPVLIKDGGYIKDDYSEGIKNLRYIIKNGKNIILEIEEKERKKTNIKNLKIKYNRIFGYYIDITKSNLSMVPENYIRKQTLANSERYITEELKVVENTILSAHDEILKLEFEAFCAIRDQIKEKSSALLSTAKTLAQLDIFVTFAKISKLNDYTRPKFNLEQIIDIKNGRHPIIEKIIDKDNFINNDTYLDTGSNQLNIITGPNMAGKSTYLRQVALISLMAQTGCFVPADSANLSIVDRIFTRVGASDDLTQGQSTFMVEMVELANILNYTTDKSLVLLDEIGRGTSTYDGLSIAWSVVEYLTNSKNQNPKSLFATHYHELTELGDTIDNVKNYNITAEKFNDNIIFLRKIVKGSADQSYGIEVAKLAGVPKEVTENAKRILKELENTDIAKIPKITDLNNQMSFFRDNNELIIKNLKNIDINKITPLESLNILHKLIKLIDG